MRHLLLAITALVAACNPSAPTPPTSPPAHTDTAPEGFSQAYLEQIAYTPAGPSLLLRDTQRPRLLSLVIGEAEAQSLQLRKERRRFVRPLTHDLLDDVIDRLGGELLKVHIDGYDDHIYTSTLFLRHEGHLSQIDARPSDALALAIGRKVPIYVKDSIFEDAGFTQQALDEHGQGLRPTPFSPPGELAPGAAPNPL